MMAFGAYVTFLVLAAILIGAVWLMLKRHGDLAVQGWEGARELRRNRHAKSVNQLTLLGFGLVAAGTVALLLRIGGNPQSMIEALAFLVARFGGLSVILGVAHFMCLLAMARTPEVVTEMPTETRRNRPSDRMRPRQAKEDPLDRVLDSALLDAPFSG